jgi:hypothetical protein
MATAKQSAANRRNAARSTGPRTKSGKARSSGNALKHGLSAEQIVMLDENPAAFEALRSDLFEHYQPTDPVAEHLVEQVAACIWRLRRVPEIEAGIFEYHYFDLQKHRARMKQVDVLSTDEERQAKDRQAEPRPVLGDVFGRAERSLNSLIRIAGAIEGSMYRAIRELERIKAERQDPVKDGSIIDVEANDGSVIDVEADGEDQHEPSKPRLIES